MNTSSRGGVLLAAVMAGTMIVAAFILGFKPQVTLAVGSAADAICAASQCNQPHKPPCAAVACGDSTNGFSTSGFCVSSTPGICGAQSSSGQNGGMQGLQQAMQALQAIQQMLQQMKGGGGGGGGGGSSSPSGESTTPGLGGCAQYYNVTTPSSDPCAVYIPPISNALGSTTDTSAANDLISSLLSGSYANQTPFTSGTTGTTNTSSQAQVTGTNGTPATPSSASSFTGSIVPASGLSGDIQYSTQDVTVLVNNVDTKGNTQVAGFYGTPAGGQPTSVIASMCSARPWANNFLSFIIPGTFFDSLCTLRGYAVGTPVVSAPAPTRTSSASKPQQGTIVPVAATSTGPYVPPQADIWAVPAAVPLGARTTIFWNAKGVSSCSETSPDGSFTQSTVSGGAATVPLSGATTYSISCVTPSGDHITNYVTVNLSAN